MGTSNSSQAAMAASVPHKGKPSRIGSEIISPRSREKLSNLADLVATGLGLPFERRQEFTAKLLEIAADRLARFDEACRGLGHDDERLAALALEEVAESLLDWALVRVVLCLWEGRGNGVHRGRKPKAE